jgi:hypothetical protein
MSHEGAIACTVSRRLHRDFCRHERFGVRPKSRAESIGPDQTPFWFHHEDTPRIFGKGLVIRRTHDDAERAAWHSPSAQGKTRSIEALCQSIGQLLRLFQPEECANFFAHARLCLRIPIEGGRLFRFQAGRHSNLKPATIPI